MWLRWGLLLGLRWLRLWMAVVVVVMMVMMRRRRPLLLLRRPRLGR
jgi:hypothetical protein